MIRCNKTHSRINKQDDEEVYKMSKLKRTVSDVYNLLIFNQSSNQIVFVKPIFRNHTGLNNMQHHLSSTLNYRENYQKTF